MKGKLIKALVDAANRSPHERISQLIFNALDKQHLARDKDGTPRDLFYTEDSVLTSALEQYP